MSDLTISVSVSRKLSDNNYGSGEATLMLTGITDSTTEDEMDELIEQGKLAFDKLRPEVIRKAKEAIK